MKNETSRIVCSRSRSDGTTYSTTPRGIAWEADATKSAFAGALSPEKACWAASMPLRATASFRSARTFNEAEVVTGGTFQFTKVGRVGRSGGSD
jgi:hypothetical protein